MAKIVSAGEVISRKYKLKKASDLNKGSAGIDGRHGYDGKVGPQGPAGPASKDGHDGHDGVDGSGFHWRGNYKPDNSYNPNDVVHYNGSSYICIKDAKGKPPSGAREYWELMAEAGSHGGGGSVDTSPEVVVYVTKATQLEGTLDSSKLYFIDGVVDMKDTPIIVPFGGLNIEGASLNTSLLFSSADNYTMFACTGGGDLSISNLGITVDGTGSRVFNLDNEENGGRIGWQSVNFTSCTSLGTISSYSQALAQNIGWRDCKDGLTCDGVWAGGWAILNSILLGSTFEGTLFKAGSSLRIGGSFRSNMNILRLDVDNGTFCDFSPSNIVLDAGFSLFNVRVNPLADALPNMPSTSVKVLIKDCVGLNNTYVGATHQPQSDSVVTVSGANTLYQITAAVTLGDAFWFSTANTNGLKLDSSLPLEVTASGTLSFSGGANTSMSIQLRKFVTTSSSYVNIGPEYTTAFSTSAVFGTTASNVSFSGNTSMSVNDRIEVWVKNNTNTDNITVKSGGQFQVAER